MGRLILNVLLSFAQFEREGPASGSGTRLLPPRRRACGWEVSALSATTFGIGWRSMKRNRSSLGTYKWYLELRSVRLLKHDLDRRGVVSKIRVSKNGTRSGG